MIALDVIGDWRASLRNVQKMWAAGVPAIPVWHITEPEDLLVGLARDYPKIAGGAARLHGAATKRRFAEQVFARVWPTPIHGLAVGGPDLHRCVPWHSVDASNWEANPARFGKWKAFDGAALGVRGGTQDLRAEVDWYLDLERVARFKWRGEMDVLARKSNVSGDSRQVKGQEYLSDACSTEVVSAPADSGNLHRRGVHGEIIMRLEEYDTVRTIHMTPKEHGTPVRLSQSVRARQVTARQSRTGGNDARLRPGRAGVAGPHRN